MGARISCGGRMMETAATARHGRTSCCGGKAGDLATWRMPCAALKPATAFRGAFSDDAIPSAYGRFDGCVCV